MRAWLSAYAEVIAARPVMGPWPRRCRRVTCHSGTVDMLGACTAPSAT
jgi:hypothetical protein